MQTKAAIRFAITASDNAVMSVVDKMNDAATTFPTRKGGCHPLWVFGHLTLVEGRVPTVLFGEPNPVAEWQKYFGEHTEPVANASAYPAFDEVRAARWARSPADDCGLIVCDDEPRFRRKRGFREPGNPGNGRVSSSHGMMIQLRRAPRSVCRCGSPVRASRSLSAR
jgi:hypothetical protein